MATARPSPSSPLSPARGRTGAGVSVDARTVPEARRLPVRVALGALAVGQGIPAVWALLAPRSFFDGFPGGGRHWLTALPPYNHHLTTDYGAAFLALAVLAALAAVVMERRVVQVAMASWLVAAVPHFAYHLTTLDRYDTADDVGNLISLGLAILIPVWVLAAVRGERRAAQSAGRVRASEAGR